MLFSMQSAAWKGSTNQQIRIEEKTIGNMTDELLEQVEQVFVIAHKNLKLAAFTIKLRWTCNSSYDIECFNEDDVRTFQ